MKKIVCELCGESDFIKEGEFFVCQVCGAKYTVAEARKLFVDVDAAGSTGTSSPKPSTPSQTAQAPQAPVGHDEEEFANEDPVLAPKAVPTTVRRVVVQQKTPSNDPSAVKRIVSNVSSAQPQRVVVKKPVVKRVVVRKATTPVVEETVEQVQKPVTPVQRPIAPEIPKMVGEKAQMIQNLFILAQTAYDSENFVDAEQYANRIIEIDATNSDAWLMKGNCAGKNQMGNFRLVESINCWNTCLANATKEEYEDYAFTVRTNCMDIAIDYIIKNIQDFKKNPSDETFNLIKEKVDYVDPIMRKANQTFGVDIITYEDRLASNIAAIVNEVSKNATTKFGKRKEQQTDAALQQFKETQDQCIIVWDYLIDLAKRHGTVTAILKNLVKMHETIIRAVSYRQSGSKLKESTVCSMSEKNIRLEKIQKAKLKLDSKFVDIRKRDRVEQKIKNEKYWEEHLEEKQQLLDERSKLDHEVFELENSKLKMPKLTELKKLEEEAIRLQVLKDNPTYTGKERTAFMEELQKTRKQITTKKREIANIINPIDERIEKLKKRMYNIDKELNQNR
jgi:hypothetical protein